MSPVETITDFHVLAKPFTAFGSLLKLHLLLQDHQMHCAPT